MAVELRCLQSTSFAEKKAALGRQDTCNNYLKLVMALTKAMTVLVGKQTSR